MFRTTVFCTLVAIAPAMAALSDGLAAYYAENISNGHPDATGIFPGTVTAGGPVFGSGKIGGAYDFAGAGLGSDPRVRASISVSNWQAGSVSVWIRPTHYQSGNMLTIWQFPEASSWGHLWLGIHPTTRRLNFHIGDGRSAPADASSTTALSDDTWYHVTATWSRQTNQSQLYVNGRREATATVNSWGIQQNSFYWGAGFNGYGMRGTIDELGVWNRVLNDAEIASLYNSGNGVSYPFAVAPPDTSTCRNGPLLVQFVSPAAGAVVRAGQTVPIQVKIADGCGDLKSPPNDTVTAAFGNGDPAVTLASTGGGVWSGAWRPVNESSQSVRIVTLAAFASGSSSQVGLGSVTVNLAPATEIPKLSLGTNRLTFNVQTGSDAVSTAVPVSNIGGGTLRFNAFTEVFSDGDWLSVTPSSGEVSSTGSQALTVVAKPGALPEGTYFGLVYVQGGGVLSLLSVTLSVTRQQGNILLSQAGLSYIAVQGGGNPSAQAFGILNQGTGELPFTVEAKTLSGGAWLTLTGGSGRVVRPLEDVSMVEVGIDSSKLTQGDYYAELRVSSPGVINSPQIVTVLVKMLAPGANPGPEIRPSGLIFIGAPGSSPAAETFRVTNLLPRSVSYYSAPVTLDGTPWIAHSPAGASGLAANTSEVVTVRPNFTGLAPGVKTGTITYIFADQTVRNVNVLSIVPAAAALKSAGAREAAGCQATLLSGEYRFPAQDAAAVVGQPLPIEVKFADACGNLLVPGTKGAGSGVTIQFSNGDPDLRLVSIGNGIWSGTWRPVQPSTGDVTLTAAAVFGQGLGSTLVLQAGKATRTIRLSETANVPIVRQGALVHSASQKGDAPVAPGMLITIYGKGLAGAPQSTNLPLPVEVDGTEVLLGGQPLPILYSSESQINAQIPYSLPVNTGHQVVVRRKATMSVPESFTVARTQPGIFTLNQQGTGQGIVTGPDQQSIASPSKPAQRSGVIIIYCTGLGEVSPGVTVGQPAPSNPLSRTVEAVDVTVGRKAAQVLFSGLAPGFTGVYQVNAVLAADTPTGDAVPLVMVAGGQSSNEVTIAVR